MEVEEGVTEKISLPFDVTVVDGIPTICGKTKEELLALDLPPTLDLYDILCPPRRSDPNRCAIDPKKRTTLAASGLSSDLCCAVCLGFLKDSVTVKDCLHRFCSSCIEKCMRVGIHECPRCRDHIATRRMLRPDPVFSTMIRRLVPNIEEYESYHDKVVEQSNRARGPRWLPDNSRIPAQMSLASDDSLLLGGGSAMSDVLMEGDALVDNSNNTGSSVEAMAEMTAAESSIDNLLPTASLVRIAALESARHLGTLPQEMLSVIGEITRMSKIKEYITANLPSQIDHSSTQINIPSDAIMRSLCLHTADQLPLAHAEDGNTLSSSSLSDTDTVADLYIRLHLIPSDVLVIYYGSNVASCVIAVTQDAEIPADANFNSTNSDNCMMMTENDGHVTSSPSQ